MFYLLQMGPFKVFATIFLKIHNSRQLSLLVMSFLLRLYFSRRFLHIYQHCDFLFAPLQLVSLHCSTWSIWHSYANAIPSSHPILVYKPPSDLSPTSYLFPLHPPHSLIFFADFLFLLLSLPPLTRSGFFNGILEFFEPEARRTT